MMIECSQIFVLDVLPFPFEKTNTCIPYYCHHYIDIENPSILLQLERNARLIAVYRTDVALHPFFGDFIILHLKHQPCK